MEGVEKKVRDSIADYLLSIDVNNGGDAGIFTWLRSTPSQIGDFTKEVHAELVKKSLALENDYFKVALIDYLLLDIDLVEPRLVDAYFEALNSIEPDILDSDIVAQSLSVLLERNAIDGEVLSRKLSALNFELASSILAVLESSYFVEIDKVPTKLLKAAKNKKRLMFRVGVFWHFLFIVKPFLIKLFPTKTVYKNVWSAINDWPYNYDDSAALLADYDAITHEEKSLFEEFGSKLQALMDGLDEGALDSNEYNALCKEYYQKVFQGADIFEKIYGNYSPPRQ